MTKKQDDKQRRLDEIAALAKQADRSPIRSHDYYSALFYRILKLAEGEK